MKYGEITMKLASHYDMRLQNLHLSLLLFPLQSHDLKFKTKLQNIKVEHIVEVTIIIRDLHIVCMPHGFFG